MTCTFFGHKNAPKEKEPTLKSALIDLIENKNVGTFYVGNNGSFDNMVISLLSELSSTYPIKYYVVLAYMPNKNYAIQSKRFCPKVSKPYRLGLQYHSGTNG